MNTTSQKKLETKGREEVTRFMKKKPCSVDFSKIKNTIKNQRCSIHGELAVWTDDNKIDHCCDTFWEELKLSLASVLVDQAKPQTFDLVYKILHSLDRESTKTQRNPKKEQ